MQHTFTYRTGTPRTRSIYGDHDALNNMEFKASLMQIKAKYTHKLKQRKHLQRQMSDVPFSFQYYYLLVDKTTKNLHTIIITKQNTS